MLTYDDCKLILVVFCIVSGAYALFGPENSEDRHYTILSTKWYSDQKRRNDKKESDKKEENDKKEKEKEKKLRRVPRSVAKKYTSATTTPTKNENTKEEEDENENKNERSRSISTTYYPSVSRSAAYSPARKSNNNAADKKNRKRQQQYLDECLEYISNYPHHHYITVSELADEFRNFVRLYFEEHKDLTRLPEKETVLQVCLRYLGQGNKHFPKRSEERRLCKWYEDKADSLWWEKEEEDEDEDWSEEEEEETVEED